MTGKRLEKEIIAETLKELEKLKEEANKLKETGASYEEQKALKNKVIAFTPSGKLGQSATGSIESESENWQILILSAEILDILSMPIKHQEAINAVEESKEEGEKSDFGWPSPPAIVSSSYVSDGVSSDFHEEEISLGEKSKKLKQPQSASLGTTTKFKPDLYSQSKLPKNQTKKLVMRTPDSIENNFENAVQAITHQLAFDLQKSYIESFIKAGGDINFQDKDGKTLLYYASANLKLSVVTYILSENKGDPNIRGKHMQTPLHGACSFLPYSRDHIEAAFSIIEALLTNGADLCARNIYGETPIDTFRYSNEANYISLEKGKEVPLLKEIENSLLFTIYNILEEARPTVILSTSLMIIRAQCIIRNGYNPHTRQVELKKFLPTDSKNIWLITKYWQEKGLSSEEIKQYREIVIKFANESEMTIEDVEKLLLQAASTSLQQPSAMQLGPHNRRK